MIEYYFFKSQQIYHQISSKSQMPHPNKELELFHTTGQLTFRCISSMTTCARITCWSACTSNVSLFIACLNCAAYPNQLHFACDQRTIVTIASRAIIESDFDCYAHAHCESFHFRPVPTYEACKAWSRKSLEFYGEWRICLNMERYIIQI